MHYNATNETGATLEQFVAHTYTQTDFIKLEFAVGRELSPSDVLKYLNHKYPITSIRRCITDLTAEGFLVKTDKKKIGIYGRPEYIWKRRD
jgi:hypothetical protein